jgi:hypothetical protein
MLGTNRVKKILILNTVFFIIANCLCNQRMDNPPVEVMKIKHSFGVYLVTEKMAPMWELDTLPLDKLRLSAPPNI